MGAAFFKKAPTLFPERAPFYIHHVIRVVLDGLAGGHNDLLSLRAREQIRAAGIVKLAENVVVQKHGIFPYLLSGDLSLCHLQRKGD